MDWLGLAHCTSPDMQQTCFFIIRQAMKTGKVWTNSIFFILRTPHTAPSPPLSRSPLAPSQTFHFLSFIPQLLQIVTSVTQNHYYSINTNITIKHMMFALEAEKEVRGGRPDLATIYLDKVELSSEFEWVGGGCLGGW